MITQAVVNIASGFFAWLASLFPSWTPPDWFVSLSDYVNNVFSALNGLGAWVDWALFFGVLTLALATYVVCFTIKLVLRIAAYLPFVGGAG